MPDFAYIARDTAGKKVSGTFTAANRREVLATLGKQVVVSRRSDRRQECPGGADQQGRKLKRP